jgi:hypothetical protein
VNQVSVIIAKGPLQDGSNLVELDAAHARDGDHVHFALTEVAFQEIVKMLTNLVDADGDQILQDDLCQLFQHQGQRSGNILIRKRKFGRQDGKLVFPSQEFGQIAGGQPVGRELNLCQLTLMQEFGHPQGD